MGVLNIGPREIAEIAERAKRDQEIMTASHANAAVLWCHADAEQAHRDRVLLLHALEAATSTAARWPTK